LQLAIQICIFLSHSQINQLAMKTQKKPTKETRRDFIGAIAANTAMFSMASAFAPLSSAAENFLPPGNDLKDADAWFNKVKGKHRVAFDCTRPNEIYPFAWPRVFLLTNAATGSSESDCGVVVVLRHAAICYAMESSLWEQYKFGEVFGANDPKTGKPSLRNPFWQPAAGDFKIPGFGPVAIGINELQDSGVLFCVCDAAMTVFSTRVADSMKQDPKEMKASWVKGMLPGIQPVPSGVWALGRAHEKNCAYIFAG
jgi:intracellular sulfur oxidation DsrE/DsrF family protein